MKRDKLNFKSNEVRIFPGLKNKNSSKKIIFCLKNGDIVITDLENVSRMRN